MPSYSERLSAVDIRTRLAAAPDLPATEVVKLITRDQERRWQQGERILIETYLSAHPATAAADVGMALISAEVLVRESCGDRPGPAEYAFRFPDLADRIHTQFQLHRTLLDEPDDPEPAAAAVPV